MKYACLFLALIFFSGCGVNLAIRGGLDIDPSLERLTSDIRGLMEEYKGESNE